MEGVEGMDDGLALIFGRINGGVSYKDLIEILTK